MPVIASTDLPLSGKRAGKVRDVYPLPDAPGRPPRLLIVATDRLSAFDVVLPTPVPGKGELLTRMAEAWMRWIEAQGVCPTHLTGETLADAGPGLPDDEIDRLAPRSVVARAARVVPVECVVRGYLEGSGWRDYQRTGAVCGVPLPPGLKQCERLPEPIFTPATKAEAGEHDENIPLERAREIADAAFGEGTMDRLRDLSLEIYRRAAARAEARGVIIADTKFEFGRLLGDGAGAGELALVDEALTPDSSRFWPAEDHEPGRPQRSFDKQFVREYLEELVERGEWDKSPPGPELPDDVVDATSARYREAWERLFGG